MPLEQIKYPRVSMLCYLFFLNYIITYMLNFCSFDTYHILHVTFDLLSDQYDRSKYFIEYMTSVINETMAVVQVLYNCILRHFFSKYILCRIYGVDATYRDHFSVICLLSIHPSKIFSGLLVQFYPN
jgi:hypothetical protein